LRCKRNLVVRAQPRGASATGAGASSACEPWSRETVKLEDDLATIVN
jgi:hypothetical protein